MSVAKTQAAQPAARRRSFGEVMREPVLGPLLASRFCSIGCTIIGVTQVWSALASVTIWQCPVPRHLGIDCPGCGLSRAAAALLKGDLPGMLHWHAFAPFFLVALLAFGLAACLPARGRERFSRAVTRLEQRVPLAPALLSLLMIYWVACIAIHLI